MLHKTLADYLNRVEQAIIRCGNAYAERYEEEILTPERANLHIRIRFERGHLLEISEAVVIEGDIFKHLDYRYHFQDEQNRLVFRYDSVPHFPGLPGFPHHNHLPSGVIGSEKPDVAEAVKEALDNLLEKSGGEIENQKQKGLRNGISHSRHIC